MSKFKNPVENGSSVVPSLAGIKTKIWLYGEVALVCLLIIGVWSLASLPIVFYNLPESEKSSTSNASRVNSVCSVHVPYSTTSGICLTEFANILISSNCLPDPGRSVVVIRNEESTAKQLINGFASLGASAECLNKVVPFLCLHLFGLCGGSGVPIQPTSSQCEELRDATCQQQWMFIERLDIGLPDCEIFPTESFSCPALNATLSTNRTVTTNLSDVVEGHSNYTTAELECTGDFYQENGSSYCTRSCYTWVQFGRGRNLTTDMLGALFVSLSFLASTAIIVISCLSRKRMLIFPAIFLVYIFIDYLILDLFMIVGFMDRGNLYCTSRSLTKSLREVTSFCVIFGIVFTYIICQMALWWIFHTATLFWKVKFTFHALSFENSGKNKYIHITCITVGLLLPLVPIVSILVNTTVNVLEQNKKSTFPLGNSLISKGLGFGPNGFPPMFCSSVNSEASFYFLIVMIDFTLGCGCTMLIIIFWSLHKVYIKRKQMQKNVKFKSNENLGPQFIFGTAEKKLLTVFCYCVVLIAIVLSVLTWDTKLGLMFKDTIQKSLICELGSNNSSKCTFSDPDSFAYNLLQIFSFLLLNLLPFVSMLYVVNVQELKDFVQSVRSMIH